MTDVAKIYKERFANTGIEKRKRVWKVLCSSFFSRLVPPHSTVLDLACGYGKFINNIEAAQKFAVDLDPEAPRYLAPGVKFVKSPATDLSAFNDRSVDIFFTSNFLEHPRDKAEYWDYYDHYPRLSHLSLAEGLTIADFRIEKVIGRFLPYTMNDSTPTSDFLVRFYLALPLAWKLLCKQFLVVARKEK